MRSWWSLTPRVVMERKDRRTRRRMGRRQMGSRRRRRLVVKMEEGARLSWGSQSQW
jgi:hypothetical protein